MRRTARYLIYVAGSLASTMLPGASHTALSQQPSTAEAAWGAMTRCASLAEADARHACTDEVFREFDLLPAAGTSRAARKASDLPASAVPEKNSSQSRGPAAGRNSDDELDVVLAAVEQAGDGKLVLTTTDGTVWRQAESQTIRTPPEQGQTMTIARTRFGGFMCKPSKWVAFRCFRAR